MSNTGIEHKLMVFISSKCGGKYTIARKALKKLLEATGLVQTYVFEMEPASSEDTVSSYLEYIDQANLCVFLIDNEDGVPPAVLSEEKRAKEKHLRLLYFFCDESKKEPTLMQEGIRSSQSQKYAVVHEFSDIVERAYDSVMQDVIAVYKRKDERYLEDQNNDNSPSEKRHINAEAFALPVLKTASFPSVYKTIVGTIPYERYEDKETEETSLETLLAEQLKVVLYQKKYDEHITDCLCNEVIKLQGEALHKLIRVRYKAQKSYYLSQYAECLQYLQSAIRIAIESSEIPIWLVNDIAIDLRHVHVMIDHNNMILTDNPGQQQLNKSVEPVYYPYLDRQIETMNDEIAKRYYIELTSSPYTTNFGGLNQMFISLANAFCIAQLFGSIVQSVITVDRLISIYSMLCTLYEEHSFWVEYVSLLIINRDAKKLDTVIRTYNQSIDILTKSDLTDIIERINNISNCNNIIKSKYLLASRLGYYMDEATYRSLYDELVEYSIDWVADENRVFSCYTYIFDFYKMNTRRAKGKDIVRFICAVFEKRLARFYLDSFKILIHFDFSLAGDEDQKRVKQLLFDITLGTIPCDLNNFYEDAVIRFCKTTTVSISDLEQAIMQKCPTFYHEHFSLELSIMREGDAVKYIGNYLEEARSRNAKQGVNGAYCSYGYESFSVIYNIVAFDDSKLGYDLLQQMVEVILETLAAEKQTTEAKLAAVRLLQLLYLRRPTEINWNQVSESMTENIAVFSTGYSDVLWSKDANPVLDFQCKLFLCHFSSSQREWLLDELFSSNTKAAFYPIQLLETIDSYLENSNGRADSDLLRAFLYYAITMSSHKEHDVKFYATKCLIELTGFDATRTLSLIHLSQIMDTGTEIVKLAIISRVKRIKFDDNSYVTQIISKGKSDNNFLVRYYADQEYSAK